MDINIRKATKADISSILELNIVEYIEDRSIWMELDIFQRYEIGMWWLDEKLLNWHLDILDKTDGGIYLIYDGDNLVGELDFTKSTDYDEDDLIKRAHIIWLLIDHKCRGKGLGKQLINKLLEEEYIPVWVEGEDERSINLYEKIGCRVRTILNYSAMSINPMSQSILVPNPKIIKEKDELKQIYNCIAAMIKSGDLRLLLGNYYAPYFDIIQLSNPDPEMIIWGGMDQAFVALFEFEDKKIYAILTQYPRIFISADISERYLIVALHDIFMKIIELGYESVQIQVYSGLVGHSMLINTGLNLISDGDYVYNMQK